MNLKSIISEIYDLQKAEVLLKTSPKVSKTEIINKIRAIPYVIIVRVREDPRLLAQSTDNYEYSLLSMKFLNFFNKPTDTLNKIKNIIINGDSTMHKIHGVLDFRPLHQTLQKI